MPAIAPLISVILSTFFVYITHADKRGVEIVSISHHSSFFFFFYDKIVVIIILIIIEMVIVETATATTLTVLLICEGETYRKRNQSPISE